VKGMKWKKAVIEIVVIGIVFLIFVALFTWLPIIEYLVLKYNFQFPTIFPRPEIIPKGKIAFAVIPDYDEKARSIYVADADGKDIVLLVRDIRIRGEIDWSPDGKYIVFTICSKRDTPERKHYVWYPEIYTINTDGTNLTRIAEGESPTWSPP
jgi:Tol biopolymer transport system component